MSKIDSKHMIDKRSEAFESSIQRLVEFGQELKDKQIDGKAMLMQMQFEGMKGVRQTEYPAFFCEGNAKRIFNSVPDRELPNKCDFFNPDIGPGEVKAHCVSNENAEIILNSTKQTDALIDKFGKEILIIFEHESNYDGDGSFKNWHTAFKGGRRTSYKSKSKNPYSRKMKTDFTLKDIKVAVINSEFLSKCEKMKATKNRHEKYKISVEALNEYAVSLLQ